MTAERALHELQLDMRSQVEKYEQLQEARRSVLDCVLACMMCFFATHLLA